MNRAGTIAPTSAERHHPEIVMLHISNLWKYDRRDTIYPVHAESLALLPARPDHYIIAKASDQSTHRIAADHILYIETVKRSAKLQIHMRGETLTINGTLPELEKKYPGFFLRIHASYMINPDHVREIRRFCVTLSDGTQLPVPEKKYTQIKKSLTF